MFSQLLGVGAVLYSSLRQGAKMNAVVSVFKGTLKIHDGHMASGLYGTWLVTWQVRNHSL